MSKELIQKALINALDDQPKDFYNNIEKAASLKLKGIIEKTIKEKEKNLFIKI